MTAKYILKIDVVDEMIEGERNLGLGGGCVVALASATPIYLLFPQLDRIINTLHDPLVESKLTETKMEVIEDDLFFADLSKRISLLIMDDDEDPTLHCPPVSFQVISQTIHPIHHQVPSLHDQNGRREIKGTGVFIPQSSTNRRSKHSRSKSSNTRIQTQRHVDHASSGHFPHEPYHNHKNSTNPNSYNSLNHKRCY
ncbi:hypothetical protein Ccrd_004374 [Cynara cardunculus var. scolymus]|uniref:Uncharacterized protein n=1 Tax=Cynara cardunculus var. scolymus TaxID=59895 RepID=A0A103XMP0_CYNCS|nr:hypothetical protein Ccrd_004374 [Cynara cardunculus var. scolymus]